MENSMIIVTGAAGFIGSNIVAELEEAGHKNIVAIDYFGDGDKWRNIAKHTISAFVAPEKTAEFLDENANKITHIIHMGAITSSVENNVDLLIEHNINYSLMLWDWCTLHKVPFIYGSSAATYGETRDFKENIDTLTELKPLSSYGWSKNAADIIFSKRVANGMTPPQWVGLKLFTVYGPNEYHKDDMRSVITKFYDDIQIWGAIKLFKSEHEDILDGEQKRDFVYVKDCSQAVLWFMGHSDVCGIYNLGTGHARSFLELAKAMEMAMGKKVEISFQEMPKEFLQKYQYYTEADMTKARGAGMSVNFRSLEGGITDFVENYLSTDDIYR